MAIFISISVKILSPEIVLFRTQAFTLHIHLYPSLQEQYQSASICPFTGSQSAADAFDGSSTKARYDTHHFVLYCSTSYQSIEPTFFLSRTVTYSPLISGRITFPLVQGVSLKFASCMILRDHNSSIVAFTPESQESQKEISAFPLHIIAPFAMSTLAFVSDWFV